jgi:hypothetical protein
MPQQIKLQVPMEKSSYEGLLKRADELGFDSVQAYVRFWAKAETSQRAQSSAYQDLSKPDVQALRYIEMLLSIKAAPVESASEALEYIKQEITRTKALKKFKALAKDLDDYH